MRAKRLTFLAALVQSGNVLRACRTAGINTAQPYQWAHKNDVFAQKMREAQARGEQQLLAEYEDHLDTRAKAGPEDRMSAILLMFRMKRLDPRYRDNATVQLAMTGPVAITLGLDGGSPDQCTPSAIGTPDPMNGASPRLPVTGAG